ARYAAVGDGDAGDLAVLQDVNAAPVGGTGKTPDHGVVPRGAAAPLQQAALDREARVVEVEVGVHGAHLGGVEQLGIDPVQPHRVAAPRRRVARGVGVEQVQ